MKWTIAILSLALVATICASKKVPKGMTKADKEFLRAVEKQFQLYGDSLKIQVKSDNTTESGTEQTKGKRTVGGHYGYGYNNGGGGGHQNNYQFSAPKFEIYPYSQHDLVPHGPQHTNGHQQGFNLQQTHGHGYSSHQQVQSFGHHRQQYQHHEHQHHEPQHQHQDDQQAIPVIVLRVPGPPAYAAHLQALLQAYILSRTEQLRQQHRALTHSYGTPLAPPLSNYEPPQKHQHDDYQVQNVQQSNQVHEQHEIQHPVQQAPQYLPAVQEEQQEEVHHQHQPQHQHHHQQSYQYQHQQEPQSYEEPSAEYGVPEQQVQYEQEEDQHVPEEPHHQQEQVQYEAPQQNYAVQYVVQQQQPGHQLQSHYHSSNLPTNENYPSDSHTRVIFPTHQQYQATRPQYQYQQHSHDVSENYEEPPASPEAQQREREYLPHVGGEKGPYNYHAHHTRNAQPQAPERFYSREQSRKYNQLIAKLRRGISSKTQ